MLSNWFSAFRKESRKLQTRYVFEHYYFDFCRLSCRYVMFQKRILSKLKRGAQAVVGGARPPLDPRNDGTGKMPNVYKHVSKVKESAVDIMIFRINTLSFKPKTANFCLKSKITLNKLH